MSLFSLLLFMVLVMALLETPVFTVIAGLSMVCLYFSDGDWLALQSVIIEMNRLASMPVLVALPLFTLVGTILTGTRAPRRIMDLVQALAGWLPGGTAMAALVSCAFFTALTGASGVTIVALGTVLYPVLRQRGHPEKFTLGLLTTGGSLGLLFPPSLPIILYGVVGQVDINQIFKAALIPGLLLVLVLCGYAFWSDRRARRLDTSKRVSERFSLASVGRGLRQSCWDWPIVLIIIIGVYGGYATIAEVSALVLAYVIIVECLILKEVDLLRQLPQMMVDAAMLSGAIIVILGFALGFTSYLVDAQIPSRVLAQLTNLSSNKYVFLAGLNLFLLVTGCIMDIFSAIVIVVPIIVPIAISYAIDPIHLCIIFLVNLEIGYSTPPVGINLFIAGLRFNKPVTLLYRASVPYLILLLAVLVLVTYLPAVSLWLIG